MTSLYNGGAEKSLVNMLNEFPKDKYEIDLLLFKRSGMFLKQVPENVNVLETPTDLKRLYGSLKEAGYLLPKKLVANVVSQVCSHNSREKRGVRWEKFYGSSIKKLDKHYDVALAYISGEVLYYVDEKVNADKKIVWVHNDYRSEGHPKTIDYPHFKNMDAIVSISDTCVDILKEEFPEFSNKVYMLENITSSAVLNSRAKEFVPEEFGTDYINILSIGRLDEQKGFDMAIKASKIMKDSGLKFKWFVIGSGDLKGELEKQIHAAGVGDCFILLGTRENPYPYTKNCDIFVQPSRFEGKSVVIDEAKILAAPIVATAYPTVGDQLLDKVEGMIVPLSVEGIADGLLKMAEDKEMRSKYSDYLASKEYGNQKEIEKYIQLIEG